MKFTLACLFAAVHGACPTIPTQADFNLTEYIRSTWFIQQQQVTEYLSVADNYCVAATYVSNPKKTVPFFDGEVVEVYNYANENSVNGKNENSGGMVLCARVPDKNEPAKLLVAPCFLPNVLAGDYWIVAAGPSPTNYEWAIVSGGQPTIPAPDGGAGCTTKTTGTNGAGFWLFTREPVASAETIATMRATALSAGIALNELNPVSQEGCSYTGALLKNEGSELSSPPPSESLVTQAEDGISSEASKVSNDVTSEFQKIFMAAPSTSAQSSSTHGLGAGAVVGVAAFAGVLGVAVGAFAMQRRQQNSKDSLVLIPDGGDYSTL